MQRVAAIGSFPRRRLAVVYYVRQEIVHSIPGCGGAVGRQVFG